MNIERSTKPTVVKDTTLLAGKEAAVMPSDGAVMSPVRTNRAQPKVTVAADR